MHLAVHMPQFTVAGGPATLADELRRAGAAADTVGLSDLSVMDHWFQMEAMWPVTDPMLEGYTTLAFLAAHTERVRLGLLVTGVTYRHPGLLAKTVSTLDVLSGGRAQLGIGAAWYEREHQGLGVPFPSTSERFERLEEALQICLQMWDPDANGPYDGTHYQLAETLNVPAPLSRPRPPIMIGGSGERKTLRLVAQYADACNLFAGSPDDVVRLLDVLARHGEDVGRDTSEIRVTTLHHSEALGNDLDAFTDEMAAFGKVGVDTIYVMAPGDRPATWIEEVAGPAAARMADLPVG